jgi:putative transposase
MTAVLALASEFGTAPTCEALGLSRASLYRKQRPVAPPTASRPRTPPARALSQVERDEVLTHLNSERFVDKAPRQVWAELLDEGEYVCSVRTMYRILEDHGEARERRDQLTHPQYTKPELVATGPNQVWSWDITKLLGPATWVYYQLYVILDIFSRYVVGWLLAPRESAALAEKLIEQACLSQEIPRGQLTLHADRGSSMRSKPVAMLLIDLGVGKSHSRPHVSNDNPFSEAHFKTFKYRPEFPKRFGCIEDARVFCRTFFHWYNTEHRHSGIGLLTPKTLHYGGAASTIAARQTVLTAAYSRHPERFVTRPPVHEPAPVAVWINPPKKTPPSSDGSQA